MNAQCAALATSAILFALSAHASCPTPAVLKPAPGEVTGCPVYARTGGGRVWFSNFFQPADNALYGFPLDSATRSAQAAQIVAIAAQNWALTQLSNVFGRDFALAAVTFTPTAQTFDTPDGTVIVTTGGIRQGF